MLDAAGQRHRQLQVKHLCLPVHATEVFIARNMQRAALEADRSGLIPANPPKEALEARRRDAQRVVDGDHYHTVAKPASGETSGAGVLKQRGYRPGRKSQQRRKKN